MDRYGGGLYKGYAAQNGVRTYPVSGDWSKRGSSRPDDRVRTGLVPDPASGTNPSDGEEARRRGSVLPLLPNPEKEISNLAGKNMGEMAYNSPRLSKHSSPKKVDPPAKDHMDAHQHTSLGHHQSQRFDDFIKKVHGGVNQPHGSAAPMNSHQPPYSSSVNGIPSRGDYSVDYEKERYNKPTANGFRNDDSGEYIRKSGRSLETNTVNHGGWSRPIRPTWRPALSPQANGSRLGEPTTVLDKLPYSSDPNGLTYSDDYSSHSYNDREKPAGNMTRNGGYDDYHGKNEATRDTTTINDGAWARPRHVAWASPPDNGSPHGIDQTYNISKQDMDSFGESTKLTSTAAAQSGYPNRSKGYGDGYTDYNNKEGNGNYSHKNGSSVTREPTTGNWTRPNLSSWISSPRNDTQVTKPTSDIGKVIGLLNEAVNPTSGVNAFPRPRYSVPISTAPNKDAYQETTDRSSFNNGRRYGNFKFPSQPR